MNRLIRLIAICFGSLILWTSPLQAQERSAVRAGFELPANSGKKILIFRPRISVGSQSTGGMFEPNAEWTDRAKLNMQSRSEEHTSELQSLMRISYDVFCLKKKNKNNTLRDKVHKTPYEIRNKTQTDNRIHM